MAKGEGGEATFFQKKLIKNFMYILNFLISKRVNK